MCASGSRLYLGSSEDGTVNALDWTQPLTTTLLGTADV